MIENRLVEAVEKIVFTRRTAFALGAATLVAAALRISGGRRSATDTRIGGWALIDVSEYIEDSTAINETTD